MTTLVSGIGTDVVDRLSQTGLTVAVDTEFEGLKTLTAQFASRAVDGRLLVHAYRAPEIPEPSALDVREILSGLEVPNRLPIACPIGVLRPELSPVCIIRDLVGISDLTPVTRAYGHQLLHNHDVRPANGDWDEQRRCWRIPSIEMTVVSHFLSADLGRIFGRAFYWNLFEQVHGASDIHLTCNRRLSFAQGEGARVNHRPIVEFAATSDGRAYAIRLQTVDTTLPFGGGSLDQHGQTFLGARRLTHSAPKKSSTC